MFKIITTKRYEQLKFAEFMNEIYNIVIDTAINELKNKPEKEVVNVYKLQVKPDLKKTKGVKFSGTKKQLDKFIKRNSTKKARKEHEKRNKA